MMNKTYKRQYRELSQETRTKIANALKNRSKSATQKSKISDSMTRYWQSVPNKPNDDKTIN